MAIELTLKLRDKAGESKEIRLLMDESNPNEHHIREFLQLGVSYEPDVTKLLQRILEPGDVFVDVGANVGFFTVLGATLVGPAGKVYAYEPDPKNIARIRFHCANNGIDNVEVIGRPVSHCVEDVTFWFNKASSGGNALWNPGEYFGDPGFNDGNTVMQSTTLADEFDRRGLEKVKLIKIDTEGAEHAILRGTASWLKDQSVPYIIAELNPFGLEKLDTSVDKFIEFMYDNGYLAFLLFFDGRPPQFVAPGMNVHTPVITNLLFTTPAGFSKLWSIIEHNPGVMMNKETGKMGIAA
jgi:FkbM family methyltransferase